MTRAILLASIALVAMVTTAEAGSTATGTGTANSSSNSTAVAIGGGGGAGGSSSATGGNSSVGNTNASSQIIFNTPGSTSNSSRIRQSGSLKTTPTAAAPGLGSAGIETCYGPGVSAGMSVTGFGASFGAGQYDSSCNRRLNARTMFAMGYKEVAIRIMANEPEVQNAMAAAGIIRPEPGDISYRGPAQPVAYARSANSSGLVNQGCKKWSGGATGVGSCLY